MDAIPIGELKANFSTILGRIKKGEKIIISFGKQKEKVAILSPYAALKGPKKRKLGLLKGKASFMISADFKIRDEEFLSL
jgi:antitoxin (DNA-binding transcriptional repressor) of toxin-antitoxin stability system